MHRSFTMSGEARRENEIAIPESAARDSLKKPVLASGDETRSRWA
jgi:hypothetical protein